MTAADELIDRKEAAAFCKISERTLDRQANLPRVKLTARRVVYRRADLMAWVASRVCASGTMAQDVAA